MKKWKDFLLYFGALFVFTAGMVRVLGGAATVSNSVGGRELPIYCVESKRLVSGWI